MVKKDAWAAKAEIFGDRALEQFMNSDFSPLHIIVKGYRQRGYKWMDTVSYIGRDEFTKKTTNRAGTFSNDITEKIIVDKYRKPKPTTLEAQVGKRGRRVREILVDGVDRDKFVFKTQTVEGIDNFYYMLNVSRRGECKKTPDYSEFKGEQLELLF
ncbi:MAG: hypothetical protein GTN76_06900 [Candidatus Aenigmarchaeota archaeon]|nr:hypothetical protein [Candidatus Aenigmarchaeota archaeon]